MNNLQTIETAPVTNVAPVLADAVLAAYNFIETRQFDVESRSNPFTVPTTLVSNSLRVDEYVMGGYNNTKKMAVFIHPKSKKKCKIQLADQSLDIKDPANANLYFQIIDFKLAIPLVIPGTTVNIDLDSPKALKLLAIVATSVVA